MKRTLIAAALLSFVSVGAFATGTNSSSSSTSGGTTSASVSGFGHFTATDYGTANGNAQSIAGGTYGVTGNYTNATTSHSNTSTVGGFGHGTSQAGGTSGADAAANAWSKLGGGWR
jgi:hypothetical protein